MVVGQLANFAIACARGSENHPATVLEALPYTMMSSEATSFLPRIISVFYAVFSRQRRDEYRVSSS